MFTALLQGSRYGYTDKCNTGIREEVLLPLLEKIGASSSTHKIYTLSFWPVIMLLTQPVLITVVTAEVFVTVTTGDVCTC